MRPISNDFKNNIKLLGRKIKGRIYYYANYNIITEDGDTLLTEDNIELLTEQYNSNDKQLLNEDNAFQIDLIKNGNLLQSLMKECDFKSNIELNIGTVITPELGLLVGENYEYINYGNYIVYSKEYLADEQVWKYVCYDKMLYSMIKYKPLNILYPTTIRQFIIALADRIGLDFANKNDNFTNYNEVIQKELFENQNLTYRDILDKLSEITASNILINDNEQLELGYPSETNDTINEDYINSVNVLFKEKFGVINKVAITDGNISYVKQNDASIETNGVTQVNIVDNILTLNGNTDNICQAILNKLNGLYYYINDFDTTGVCYYDYLDLYNVEIENSLYKCLLLNNEIHIKNGIKENIFTFKLENTATSENNYEISTPTNKTIFFKMNQQQAELELRVEKDGVISSINQSPEQIQINANKLDIKANDVLNILANNTINLTSKNIEINSTNFSVTQNGTIKALSGLIGSWNIGNQTATGETWGGTAVPDNTIASIYNTTGPALIQLKNGATGAGYCGMKSTDGSFLYAGASTSCNQTNDAKFKVSHTGALTSTSGSIGGFTISNSHLQRTTANGNVGIGTDIYGNTPALYIEDSTGDNWAVVTPNGGYTNGTWSGASLEKYKKNFTKLENATNIIKQIDIYEYNLKQEKDNDKKHIGFVIGDKFNYSQKVTNKDNDGYDLYSFVSVCCKAIQEQQNIIEELTKKMEKLERNNK